MGQPARLHVRSREGELTLALPEESIVRLLAAARSSTGSLGELLKEARRYDATLTPALAHEAREDIDDPNAPYRIDLTARRIAFPAGRVALSRRGVIPVRSVDGIISSEEHATYDLGRAWTLIDSADGKTLDGKAEFRREKTQWSQALPADIDDVGAYRVDGVDFSSDSLRDVHVWTLTANERAPEVNGKSVYELTIEGPRHATVMGQTHDEATRSKGAGHGAGRG